MPEPVALNIKVPDTLNTLRSIADFANTAINIQRGGIQLQRETQANNERLALQKFLSVPDNFQTDGSIDLEKVNKSIPAIAPMTGPEVIGRLTTLGNAQTSAREAKLKLSGERREVVSGPYGVLGRAGVEDPQAYIAEGNKLKAQYPDDPDVAKLVDAYNTTLGMLPPGPHIAKAAITASQSILNPSQQQAQLTPQAGTLDTGGTIQPTVVTPSVAGQAPSVVTAGAPINKTLSPGALETIETDAAGNKAIVSRSPQGSILSTRSMPGSVQSGGPNAPLWNLPPGSRDELPLRTKQRVQVNDAAATVPAQHLNNQQIIKLADTAYTGTGAEEWARVMGSMGIQGITGDAAADFQRMQHFMALQSQQNAAAMGAGTDASRAIAEAATNKTNWTKDAVISTAKVNDALATGLGLFNQGMERAVEKANGNVLAIRDFQNAWSRNFDPMVMQLKNAKENGDSREVGRILSSVGGRDSPRAHQLIEKARIIRRLSEEGR